MNSSPKRTHEEVDPEKLSSSEVLSVVKEIVEHNGSEKEKTRLFRKKYPSFVEGYPVLFEMACRPNFDFARLQYMLSLKDSVDKNTLSQHDASVRVGKVLYDVYVKDKVSQIDPNSSQK
jgi:hypothetical protein